MGLGDIEGMRRVELLLGKPLGEVDSAAISGLVSGRVKEDTDLDFKQELYGLTDNDKRKLATDVAAMANAIGGVIILGVIAVDGAASGLKPVAISEGEELRIRQAIFTNVAPVPRFSIYPVPEAPGAATGFYLISILRSPNAPHAVPAGVALRFPRREGTLTRYLSESEVADGYRNRFQQATDQAARLTSISTAGVSSLAVDSGVWLTMAILPIGPGQMELRQRTLIEARQWVQPWLSGGWGGSVFESDPLDVHADVGRVVIPTPKSDEKWQSTKGHAELYQDGSGFGATRLAAWWFGSDDPTGVFDVHDEQLVGAGLSLVRFLVDHASRRTGAVGDAVGEVRVVVPHGRSCRLVHARQGFRDVLTGTRHVSLFAPARHQLNLEDCQTTTGALIVARMFLTELFQSFGFAEVLQVTATGQLRSRYLRPDMTTWAAQNGVEIVETLVESEP
jgi:hypothetical protein